MKHLLRKSAANSQLKFATKTKYESLSFRRETITHC